MGFDSLPVCSQFFTHMASSRVVFTSRHILKLHKNYTMKQVLNVTFMISIFAIILKANRLGHNVSLGGGIVIFILSFLASTVIVTISEVIKIDKEVAEDNKLYTHHKSAQMIDQKDSLED